MAAQDILNQWGPIFDQIAPKYGLDPDLLKAISLQENVNPSHNNPLGLSDDSGVHSYPDQASATAAIERQARLLSNPNGPYSAFVKSGSIQDLARVYSPVGAKNDPNQTNATEGSGIVAQLAKLKGGAYSDAAPLSAPTMNPAPSYLGNGTPSTSPSTSPGTATPAIPASQWGSPLLDQIRQLQTANSLMGSMGRPVGAIQQPQGNQVVSALNNAIKTAQIIAKLRGGASGASAGLSGNLGDFLGSGAYRAGLTQADPFGAGGSFDVTA